MSLVNYGYSDDDDDGDNDKNESDVISKTLPIESNEKKSTIDNSIANDEIKSIRPSSSSTLSSSLTFKHLTKSNSRIQIKAFDDNLALMNQQPNGLVDSDDSDDDDEDNRARKRMKRSEKGSSLISMLPKPKNAKTSYNKSSTINEPTTSSSLTSLVPNSVSNRTKVSSLTSKLKPAKNENNSNFFFADPDNDDDDDDDDDNGDHIKMIPKPWTIEDNKDDVLNPVAATAPTLYHQAEEEEEEETSSFAPIYGPSKPIEQEKEETYIDPNDDITYKKLIASKFDDNVDNIRIVDVNVQKHLSENKDWLKNISLEKDTVDEALESKAPNSTAKRKNQITFLAYQAKKRELELKNQWAQNRLSKSQTRAKYGF